MFERTTRIAGVLTLGLATACGGGDLEVYGMNGETNGETTSAVADTGTTPDTATNTDPDPNDVGETPDMGVVEDMSPPDMSVDMGTEPDPNPAPTTNVPQSGPTVASQITNSCSTSAVRALSTQLIDQMNCLDPGIMKSFAGAPSISYGASVFPYQQGPATDTLTAVAANNAGTIPINSALRMIPGQFLLYEWYQRGLCNANLAASPGRSNHNGGLAVDIGNSSTWRSRMRAQNYIDNVSGEPWHFFYNGAGGKDVRSLSVLAFQQLYNYNFPENPIDEDGAYGPQTESALEASPAEGFAVVPMCMAARSLVAYPWGIPMDLEWDFIGDGLLGVHTNVPNGIHLVEYYIDDVLVGFADYGTRRFETVVRLPRGASAADVEAVAYNADGAEKGRARGVFEIGEEAGVFARPLGGNNFEVGVRQLPDSVRSVEFFVDGVLTERSRKTGLLTSRFDQETVITAVLLDRKDRVVDLREVTLEP